jgi:hypothetical protein
LPDRRYLVQQQLFWFLVVKTKNLMWFSHSFSWTYWFESRNIIQTHQDWNAQRNKRMIKICPDCTQLLQSLQVAILSCTNLLRTRSPFLVGLSHNHWASFIVNLTLDYG